MTKSYLVILLFLVTNLAQGQHTMSLKDGQSSPKATLTDINWLAGHWQGEAFGGITEEIWAPPLGGSMMGVFKLVSNDEVNFYEIMTIRETGGTILLQLKHFHSDLKGWETQDETVDFPLVKVTPEKVYFDDFTIERIDENTLHIYVVIESKTGEQSETLFSYTRKV
jgi:hypothetical protein